MAYSIDPIYRAEATVLLNTKSEVFSQVQERADAARMSYLDSQTFMATQILLIQSRALAEAVVDRLTLWEYPEFDPRQAKPRRPRFSSTGGGGCRIF